MIRTAKTVMGATHGIALIVAGFSAAIIGAGVCAVLIVTSLEAIGSLLEWL